MLRCLHGAGECDTERLCAARAGPELSLMAVDIVLHRADTHSVSPQPPKMQEMVWG